MTWLTVPVQACADESQTYNRENGQRTRRLKDQKSVVNWMSIGQKQVKSPCSRPPHRGCSI